MTPVDDKIRRWLKKNGSQKVRVTWCNGFVDKHTYEARQLKWDKTDDSFYVTHVERQD